MNKSKYYNPYFRLQVKKTVQHLKGFMVRNLAVKDKMGYLSCRCNICGNPCKSKVAELSRENISCSICRSTVRTRAIINVLSLELFGKSLVIADFPTRLDIVGIGMSDHDEYSRRLQQKLGYNNTYYHQEPMLDITSIDPALEGTLDFIISSDVYEHIPPPVSIAFINARKLLKPNGVFIFTVPYTKEAKTIEHFPHLYHYEILKKNDISILRNITKEGTEQVFDNLVFHGGPGLTIEMRVFSESSLKEEFTKAGFNNIKVYSEPYFDYGIYWEDDLSLPIAARIK